MYPMQQPKFIFFGTPRVARETLAALVGAGYVPIAVVTNPPAPKGRGMELMPSETEVFAREQGLPVHTDLDALPPADYGVVVAYGKILSEDILNHFPLGLLNVHYSLLPRYRGAAPVETALLHGEKETGVTVQRLALKMDAGDVLAYATEGVRDEDTVKSLRPRLTKLGATLLLDTLPGFLAGNVVSRVQDATQVTYAPKLKKSDGELVLSGDGWQNWLRYRAFDDASGTYFFGTVGSKTMRVKIVKAAYIDGMFVVQRVVPEGKSEQDYTTLLATDFTPLSSTFA
jgi:methionyl-tRNA formyltransferase